MIIFVTTYTLHVSRLRPTFEHQPDDQLTGQSEKPKAAGKKEKAPEITDEAFPSLPGAAPKPKVEEEGGGEASGEGAQDGEVIGDREVEQDTAVEADANGNGTVEEGVVVEAAAGPTAAEIVVAANVMVKSVEEVEVSKGEGTGLWSCWILF